MSVLLYCSESSYLIIGQRISDVFDAIGNLLLVLSSVRQLFHHILIYNSLQSERYTLKGPDK